MKSYDFKGKRLKSTKTGRAREVPVHATLAEVLGAWIKGGWERFMGRPPRPSDLLFPSGKPHLTHGQFRNNNLALKQFHRYCELLGIRSRRIHDSRRTFISLARDDGAQRDVIKSLTHPLDDSDAHDSYTTFAWSRCCEEVAKLKISLRKKDQPATIGAPSATPMEPWTPEAGWISTENPPADEELVQSKPQIRKRPQVRRLGAYSSCGVDGTRKRRDACNRVNPSIVTVKIPRS